MKTASPCVIFSLALFSSTVYSQESKTRILKIFHEYVALNTNFIASVPKNSPNHKSYYDLRFAVEAYAEDVYNPVLKDAISIVCNDRDAQLLSEYFQVIIHTRNSADEYPTFVLGKMFICQSGLFADVFKQLPKNDKQIIYDAVEWGFKNVTWQKENEIPDYTKLKQKLEDFKNYID